jgi:hypothetical protein
MRQCLALLPLLAVLAGCGTHRAESNLDRGEVFDNWLITARRFDVVRLYSHWRMDEPLFLESLPEVTEAYRLWHEPPFTDLSVIRVARKGTTWVLAVRTLDGLDKRAVSDCVLSVKQSDPLACPLPRLKVNRERELLAEEVEQLAKHLKRLDFWKQPETVKARPDFDGVGWSLEGFHDSRRHEIHRIAPAADSAFGRFSDFLRKLGGVPEGGPEP